MTIILPTLAVAFAAFCIWLGVRIYNRRERWAKWTAVGIALALALYPLSVGPMVWLRKHRWISEQTIIGTRIYEPLFMICEQSEAAYHSLEWYADFWE